MPRRPLVSRLGNYERDGAALARRQLAGEDERARLPVIGERRGKRSFCGGVRVTCSIAERHSAPVVRQRLQLHHSFVDPASHSGAPVTQLRIASPVRAPDARRVRLRLKLSQLVIDRLGVGGEPKKFWVTLLVVHADNLTARDIDRKGHPITKTRGVRVEAEIRAERAPHNAAGTPRGHPRSAEDTAVLGHSKSSRRNATRWWR